MDFQFFFFFLKKTARFFLCLGEYVILKKTYLAQDAHNIGNLDKMRGYIDKCASNIVDPYGWEYIKHWWFSWFFTNHHDGEVVAHRSREAR